MTRKEMAIAIAKAEVTKKNLVNITPERFAFYLLNGGFGMKALSKSQLTSWYKNSVLA